jgi:hypothetical protein
VLQEKLSCAKTPPLKAPTTMKKHIKKTLLPYAISKQCYEQTMLIQSNCKALLASGIARKHF